MANKGFTLIELLVVISLMAFMASFVYVSFPRAHDKARAANMVQDLKTISNAFRQLKASEDERVWWSESDWGSNPNINDITEISELIPVEIVPPIEGASYTYDNDGDHYDAAPCGGVNIIIYDCGGYIGRYFNVIDDMVDGGDGSAAGRIRTDFVNSICFNVAEHEEQ